MPSSSSGTTTAEHHLQHTFTNVSAHLYYYELTAPATHFARFTTKSPNTPPRLIAEIRAFFTCTLDLHADPFTVAYGQTQTGLDADTRAVVDDIGRLKATPSQTLRSLVAWMEHTAKLLAAKGREGEAEQALDVADLVGKWVGEVEAEEEKEAREGVDGLCLKWMD